MRVEFTLNGERVTLQTTRHLKLSTFLRLQMGLTSIKEGCESGECGACSIVINGEWKRACITPIKELDGAEIITAEGVPEEQKELFARALAKLGIGCGFCANGIFLHFYAISKGERKLSRTKIMELLSHHYCRCLGLFSWPAILEEMSGSESSHKPTLKLFSSAGFQEMPRFDESEAIFPLAKNLLEGEPFFVDDLLPPQCVESVPLFVPTISGLLYKLELNEVKNYPGILSILTGDSPRPRCEVKDLAPSHTPEKVPNTPTTPPPAVRSEPWQLRPWLRREGEEIFCRGEIAAVIASESRESAREARELAQFKIEPRDSQLDVEYADNREWARVAAIFQWSQGDLERVFRNAERIVSGSWVVPFFDTNPLERPAALAEWFEDGRLRVHSAGGTPYLLSKRIAQRLGWPAELVEVWQWWAGGDFGARRFCQLEDYAAFLSAQLKKPVKLALNRDEMILAMFKEPSMRIHLSLASDQRGNFLGIRCDLLVDTGAYAIEADKVLRYTCAHLSGIYKIPTLYFFGKALSSNNLPASALPTDGAYQIQFALECLIDLLAHQLKIDPWLLRYRNLLSPGELLPNGQPLPKNLQPEKLLKSIREPFYQFRESSGLACAILGCGDLEHFPTSVEVKLSFDGEGNCFVQIPWNEDGSLIWPSIFKRLEEKGIPAERIFWEPTKINYSLGTLSSDYQNPGKYAILKALDSALEKLSFLKGDLIKNRVIIGRWESPHSASPTPKLQSLSSELPRFLSYSLGATSAMLNRDSGQVRQLSTACDIGELSDPSLLASLIEGSVFRGLSRSLHESFSPVEGVPTNVNLPISDKLFPSQLPKLEIILIEPNTESSTLPIGPNPHEVCGITVAPAIATALYRCDKIRYYRLPLLSEKRRR